MGAKKFGMSLETREIKLFGRDIPGFCRDIPEAPEKFEKKNLGSILVPYTSQIVRAARLQNEIAPETFFKSTRTTVWKTGKKRSETWPKHFKALSRRLKRFHRHFSKSFSPPKICTNKVFSFTTSCEPLTPLQPSKTPETPNLSEICPSDCFWGFQSGGLKFVKICQNLSENYRFSNFDEFFQISVPLTGTPKNNRWDEFRAFLKAARGKRVRKPRGSAGVAKR